MKRPFLPCIAILLALAIALPVAAAPAEGEADTPTTQPAARKPAPTHANVAYGPHARNVMDVWLAPSQTPTPVLIAIHGGGFYTGLKNVNAQLLDDCLKSGISVVAIAYRYSTDAIAPAPLTDGARAIQFVRSNAVAWNIDK